MNNNIKFTVVIPIYNKGGVLDKAINSVLKQTYENFEIILINDGSTDNSKDIISNYLNNIKIKYIEQTNQGVSVARNIGIINSTGDLITFLDPDDEWYENHLDTLFNCYINNDKKEALYSTAYDVKLINGKVISVKAETFNKIFKDNALWKIIDDPFSILYQYNHPPIHTNSIMIPKSIFKETGMFVPGCKRSQDTDLWYKIGIKFPYILVNKTTTLYHREESTATRKQKMNYNWPFLKTADIFISQNPSYQNINNLIKTIDVTRIAMARHLIMEGNKKEAINKLHEIHNIKSNIVKYTTTWICLIFPSQFLRKIYFLKNSSYIESK